MYRFSDLRYPQQLLSNTKDTRLGGYADAPASRTLGGLASRGGGLHTFFLHPAKERGEGVRKSVLLVATKLAVVGALALALFAGVAMALTITGTPGNDALRGTDDPDTLDGLGGMDDIFGYGGGDTIYGRAGYDLVFGYGGADVLYGGGGPDEIMGDDGVTEAGDDFLYGGAGGEYRMNPGGGADRVWGGLGDDVISLQDDGEPDVVDCGEGRDKVYLGTEVDLDTLHNCERVIR
jgi:Ca2+-binding RTX toxin-like protein